MKEDNVIFCFGALAALILILLRVEVQYVVAVVGYFGSHKVSSVVDDKIPDRINKP